MEKEILKKAKRFDEALAMAKECITYLPDEAVNKYMLNIFQELKESKGEKIKKEIIDFICWATDRGCITKEQREKSNSWLAWIEKQKEQKQVEWSEEDEEISAAIIKRITGESDALSVSLSSAIGWIGKVKDRVIPQPKEWSEEDEYCRHQLIVFCENCMQPDSGAIRCANWLKSIRPQNRWKPSDLPHWKKSNLPDDNSTGFNSDYFCYKGYNINYKELFEKLPKDD